MATLEKCDKFAYRIVDGDAVVGMALQMGNNTWCAYDKDERHKLSANMATPKLVLAWWNDSKDAPAATQVAAD